MKLRPSKDRTAIIEASLQEWLAVGLSCEPANFQAAEEAISSLYEAVDRKRPNFVRMPSPLAAELHLNLITETYPDIANKDQPWSLLREQLWSLIREQLRDQPGDRIWGQFGDQTKKKLWKQLWKQLRGGLEDQLGSQIWDQVWFQLWRQLTDQKLPYMGTPFLGQWDYFFAGLDGCRRVGAQCYAPLASMLDDHLTIMRSIGCWYPFNGFVILMDRPESIRRDDQNRLHCEDGPAISFRDGYALHFHHGVAVP